MLKKRTKEAQNNDAEKRVCFYQTERQCSQALREKDQSMSIKASFTEETTVRFTHG